MNYAHLNEVYDDYLEHYGVKGMKWGVINEESSSKSDKLRPKKNVGIQNIAKKHTDNTKKNTGSSKQNVDADNSLNLAGYREFQSITSSGKGKYETKTPKSNRVIPYPEGYTTTKQQRDDFYKNFSNQKPTGVTGKNGGIPGATIYTYRALVDSYAGKEMINRSGSAYNDCAYRTIIVDLDSGIVEESVIVADDNDVNNISRSGGNTKYNNYKNSTGLKQENSAVKVQARIKKGRDTVTKALQSGVKSLQSSKPYSIGRSILQKLSR